MTDPVVAVPVSAPVSSQEPTVTVPVASESSSPVNAAPIVASELASEAVAAPVAETVAEPASEAPKPPTSLLSEAGKDPEPPAPVSDAPVTPEQTVELPSYESYKLPEGVTLSDETQVKAFNTLLGELEAQTKIPHELMQEHGQKLVDFYVQQQQAAQQQAAKLQADVWDRTRQGWRGEVKSDPVIGRNRFETVLRDAARVRDLFATDRFKQMIEYTGAGDHPGMIEFCNNVARYLDKHGLLREGTPVPAPTNKTTASKSGPRARYAGSSGTPG